MTGGRYTTITDQVTFLVAKEILFIKSRLNILPLSELMPTILSNLMYVSVKEVRIFSRGKVDIDVDLKGESWSGINFVLCCNIIHVKKDITWDFSGKDGKSANPLKPLRPEGSSMNGTDGEDGQPGTGGGNVMIFTKSVVGNNCLRIISHGGSGGDGQPGADGTDGIAGVDGDARLSWTMNMEHFKTLLPSPARWVRTLSQELLQKCSKGLRELPTVSVVNKLTNAEGNETIFLTVTTAEGVEAGFSFFEGHSRQAHGWFFGPSGCRGTPGGLGGRGGRGGQPGHQGEVHFYGSANDNLIEIDNCCGRYGTHGDDGKFGLTGVDGKSGTDYAFVDPLVHLLHISQPIYTKGQLVKRTTTQNSIYSSAYCKFEKKYVYFEPDTAAREPVPSDFTPQEQTRRPVLPQPKKPAAIRQEILNIFEDFMQGAQNGIEETPQSADYNCCSKQLNLEENDRSLSNLESFTSDQNFNVRQSKESTPFKLNISLQPSAPFLNDLSVNVEESVLPRVNINVDSSASHRSTGSDIALRTALHYTPIQLQFSTITQLIGVVPLTLELTTFFEAWTEDMSRISNVVKQLQLGNGRVRDCERNMDVRRRNAEHVKVLEQLTVALRLELSMEDLEASSEGVDSPEMINIIESLAMDYMMGYEIGVTKFTRQLRRVGLSKLVNTLVFLHLTTILDSEGGQDLPQVLATIETNLEFMKAIGNYIQENGAPKELDGQRMADVDEIPWLPHVVQRGPAPEVATAIKALPNEPDSKKNRRILQQIEPEIIAYVQGGSSVTATVQNSDFSHIIEFICQEIRKMKMSIDEPKPKVIMITHGFLNTINEKWLHKLRTEIFNHSKHVIVILFGWGKGANLYPWDYKRAAANTQILGGYLGEFAKCLRKEVQDDATIWGIGHSLGAHLMGGAGRQFKLVFDRITGLDPAGPLFEYKEYSKFRLNAGDAKFVDVIHTDGHHGRHIIGLIVRHLGTQMPCGHADFYPNKGFRQPKTYWKTFKNIFQGISCHGLAVELFQHSVANPGRFLTNLEVTEDPVAMKDKPPKCKVLGFPVEMGYHCKEGTRGNFCIKTESKEPYFFQGAVTLPDQFDDNQAAGQQIKLEGIYPDLGDQVKLVGDWNYEFLQYPTTTNGDRLALIINIIEYDQQLTSRDGAVKDTANLKELFENKLELNYIILSSEGRVTQQEFREKMTEFHSLASEVGVESLFVIIMGHGDPKMVDKLVTSDGHRLCVETEVMGKFSNVNCPRLKGKPKVFLFQFCRGPCRDNGTPDAEESFISEEDYYRSHLMPNVSDMLIAYASYRGFVAHRSAHGSWFITTFIQVVRDCPAQWDIKDVLNKVSDLSKDEDFYVNKGGCLEIQKQMCELKFVGFTKKLYLK